MRDDVARDLSDGAYDFLRVVWPNIRHRLQEGELKPVEAVAPGELQQDLDRLAGIDAWHIRYDRGLMRGIASRVQWGDKSWGTFTIRLSRPNGSKTEFKKRCEAIDRPDEGWLFPHLTVHAYVALPRRQGGLLAAGIVRTKDLYEYARAHPERPAKRNPEDGVLFTPWWWDELKHAGIRVDVIETVQQRQLTLVPEFDGFDDYDPWAGIDTQPAISAKDELRVADPPKRTNGEWDDVVTRRPSDYPRGVGWTG